MNNNTTIQLWLLKIRSLIADKEMQVATANREMSLGGWLSDHNAAIAAIDLEIEAYSRLVEQYA